MCRCIDKLQINLLLGVGSTTERGATAVEYALMAALIASVIMFAVEALGTALNVLFGQATDAVVVK